MHAQTAVTVNVDALLNRHPINPNIYGVAHASAADLTDLNTPLNRNGGNNTSRYNWQLNADNRGNDWFYESIGDSSATPGERGDSFFASATAAGAQAMLTIPMIDWIANIGANRTKLASFSIAKYGAQTGSDWQWFADAGNGIGANGQFISGNDPNDANVPSTSLVQQAWVQHLVGRWGPNVSGGLRYYILDNEPSLWHSTHRDVQPTGLRWTSLKQRIVEYADQDQGGRPYRSRRRPRGVGLERLLLQRATISSTAARMAGAPCPTGKRTAAPTTCRGCSPRCARTTSRPARGCSMCSPCTTIRKAVSSATMSRRRCNCGATGQRAPCGIPAMWTRRGSTIGCSSFPV